MSFESVMWTCQLTLIQHDQRGQLIDRVPRFGRQLQLTQQPEVFTDERDIVGLFFKLIEDSGELIYRFGGSFVVQLHFEAEVEGEDGSKV